MAHPYVQPSERPSAGSHLFFPASLARIIVYSMAPDGPMVPPSNMPTPMFSPLPSAVSTPQIQDSSLKDYLSAPLGGPRKPIPPHAYLGGSKALDSLARMIASTEQFFHPSNSGSWTADVSLIACCREIASLTVMTSQLSAFIKYIVYDFNKRTTPFSCENPFSLSLQVGTRNRNRIARPRRYETRPPEKDRY
jgi:hypothetical protein